MREIDTGTDHLLVRVERGVAVVTLNRPHRRNALSREMLAALAETLPALDRAEDVRALVLTGAGGAFCAGGDVKTFAESGGAAEGGDLTPAERVDWQRAVQDATVGRLHAFPKPTIAALPGPVAGAGIGFALATDLRVGTANTVFAAAFGGIALPGDFGVTWLLSRLAGPARARRMLYFGERVDAATAETWGLLDWVVGPDEVDGFAVDLAAALAAGPRAAFTAMKQNLLDADRHDLGEAMHREVPRQLDCGRTDDHREAVRAFVEKRPPVFGAVT